MLMRSGKNRLSVSIVAAAVLAAGWFLFFRSAEEKPDPFAVSDYTIDTAPSPFAGLPHATTSGAIVSPKEDWTAEETPVLELELQ